ncbi:MAG: hypothetical protein ACREP6_13385 [Candidatus Binataceae bacterium]
MAPFLVLIASQAASPAPVESSPKAVPTAAAVENTVAQEQQNLISFLNQAISWYQHLAIEEQLVAEPADTLFLADDRQMANQFIQLAFDYARKRAEMIGKIKRGAPPLLKAAPAAKNSVSKLIAPIPAPSAIPDQAALSNRLDEVNTQLTQDRAELTALKKQIAHAPPKQRDQLSSQLATLRSEVQLNKSRVDALNAMVKFENKNAGSNGVAGIDLLSQIDELANTVPVSTKAPALGNGTKNNRRPAPSGIIELAERLFTLKRKQQTLDSTSSLTDALDKRIAELRTPLIEELRKIDKQGAALAAGNNANDLASIQYNKKSFDTLVEQNKRLTAALLPLAKAGVILKLYEKNLVRWRASIGRTWNAALRSLLVRLTILGAFIVLIAIGAIVWRQLTIRYIQDARHRHRVLQLRTLTVAVLVIVVLIFNFANEIGALATIMGLATAGVAVALQNVILSVAGYFFLSGRYGIKMGDRIQLAGVYGTVIDIGLVKLTLMELSGEGNYRQPSGRVVVFANSIVFQSSGNLFKQAPGINFVWNELSLTLAPDCDVHLAEKLLMDTVNDVYSHYREEVRREYRQAARDLNLWIEPPEPQSRLALDAAGVEVTIRYPVETRRAIGINDEISRRALNVINHEPRLRLVSSGTPTIQAVEISPGNGTAEAPQIPADHGEAHPPNPAGEPITKPAS